MTTVADIRRDVPSWDGRIKCSTTGAWHKVVDFNPAQRVAERLAVRGARRVRTSPDITHMLLGPAGGQVGFDLVCDPTLPPNTIAAAEAD